MVAHTPVLLEPVLTLLAPAAGEGLLVDATVGEGGHTAAFLERYPQLRVYGVDRDAAILEVARERLGRFAGRVQLWHMSYARFFADYRRLVQIPADRILFDLGISMFHLERSGRGFSFNRDEPLDMRIDSSGGPTAAQIVNGASQAELADVLRRYGEEPLAGAISRAIVRARVRAPIARSAELARIVRAAVPPGRRHGRTHPATRTFQALRIAVNGELELLSQSLEPAFAALRPGGRLGVIAFHSLEDRIVKRFVQARNRACTCPPEWPICQCGGRRTARAITAKPVTPGEEERVRNPASRSARLRVVEKLE